MIASQINTDTHDVSATVSRLRSKKAIISAIVRPTAAEVTHAVDDSIAGKVIAPSTAYGI